MQRSYYVVSHTHWDREWYQTFQQFRFRLVRLVDHLLNILDDNSAYLSFMLDGQTIIVDDYLEARPEQRERLYHYIRNGRILIGPWYCLPDEGLVSGEALIHNLAMGMRQATSIAQPMMVGYAPDTFGHTAQLPQILRGFGIDNAVLWRGTNEAIATTEFQWRAPDGCTVLGIHLADSYGNAQYLPPAVEDFLVRLSVINEALDPRSLTMYRLLMNGNDHLEPQPYLPSLLEAARSALPDAQFIHATLPDYIQKIREATDGRQLPVWEGELRAGYRSHLLPGVLSTRMWIKQANHRGQVLLERWANVMPSLAWALGEAHDPALVELAWRYLLQNQPHDSICGCSIDQVHREMATRFAWSEQIGDGLANDALMAISARLDTRLADAPRALPVVIFSTSSHAAPNVFETTLRLPASDAHFEIVDAQGHVVPSQVLDSKRQTIASMEMSADILIGILSMVVAGKFMGYVILDVDVIEDERADAIRLLVTASDQGEPNERAVQRLATVVGELATRGGTSVMTEIKHPAEVRVALCLPDAPAIGCRTNWVRFQKSDTTDTSSPPAPPASGASVSIENEFYRVRVDPASATLIVDDIRTGGVYGGLHQIVDGGDVGDLYNYSPPANDLMVAVPSAPAEVVILEHGPARHSLRIRAVYSLPSATTSDRQGRAEHRAPVSVTTRVSLSPGVRRIDFQTTVDNTVRDHRLRVHFPTSIHAQHSASDTAFYQQERPVSPPEGANWVERPVGTHPMRSYCLVRDDQRAVAVFSRGLPEYEALRVLPGSAAGVTLALTLLRCVEWLSRDDLSSRQGHAGPMILTPEAQCLGEHTFEYALVLLPSSQLPDVPGLAEAYINPPRAFVTRQHDGPLPSSLSFVVVEPASVLVSTLAKAEDNALLIRCWNSGAQSVEATLTLWAPPRRATRVRLNGQTEDDADAPISGSSIHAPMHAHQVQTFKVWLAERAPS